jgi:hypothetical protein
LGLFVEAPLIFVGFYVWLVGLKGGWRMQDFMALRDAGRALLHGSSPYPAPDPTVLLAAKHLVYPPLAGYLFAPFSVVPYGVAAPAYFFALIAAMAGALLLLGVRDWRCYGVTLLWYPTVACLGTGALGPLLVLLIAVAWRYRESIVVAAAALALAVVAKLFLWPLVVWLLATRRWRTAAVTSAAAAFAFVASFALLGLSALRGYPHLLREVDRVFGPASFSSDTLLRALGASTAAARLGVLALGIALVLAALMVGLWLGDDRKALTIALLAALLTSPIVWMHYYVLLLVPIALARPRLSALWFAPLLYWGSPMLESLGDLRRLSVGVGVTLLVTALCLRAGEAAAGDAGLTPRLAAA